MTWKSFTFPCSNDISWKSNCYSSCYYIICTYTSSMYHLSHTLRSVPLLVTDDLYYSWSTSSFIVVLCVRESISFRTPSSRMEPSCKFRCLNDLFLSSISANAIASLTPIGLYLRPNSCSVLFVHIALADWHAPSESAGYMCLNSEFLFYATYSTTTPE